MPQKQLFSTKLTQSYTSDPEGDVGKLRYEDDGRIFRFVKNAESATALTLGQACCHTISDLTDMCKNVKIPLTANLGALAGIVMATDGIAAGSYGWIQVFGLNASVSVSGATTGGTNIAAGDYLKGADTKAYLVRDAATQRLYRNGVQILTAVTTTTTPAAALVAGFITCI